MPFFYSISKAAKILDVCNKTIRRWDESGKIKVTLTPGGHRRISEDEINRILGERNNKKVEDNNKILAKNRAFIYSRVSTKKQQSSGNLDRQIERLTQYAQENNYMTQGDGSCVLYPSYEASGANRYYLVLSLFHSFHLLYSPSFERSLL